MNSNSTAKAICSKEKGYLVNLLAVLLLLR